MKQKRAKTNNKNFLSNLMGKFFVRTFISYVVIIALVFLLVYLFFQGSMRHFYIENLKTRLIQVGHSLNPKISASYRENKFAEIDRLVKEVGKKTDIRITVIAPGGEVFADSENDPGKMENHGDRPEIVQALKGEVQDATRFSSTMGEQMLYLALPVEERGETKYVLRLSLFLSDIKNLMADIRYKLATVLVILFFLALLIAYYFSRGFSRPIGRIVSATKEFAAGNFDVKIYIEKKDELGQVAENFNSMVEEQRTLFKKLSESREELQAIISSMKEGLLVLTPEGKITLCNESFEAIAPSRPLIGASYWETCRIAGFEDFVKRAFKTGESFNEEIEIDGQSFQVGFSRLQQGEKLVIIFRNITEFKQLHQMKRDFVVNLTHELKTPLTAIKGFVETLEEEEDIRNTNYIDIIKRHTDRMNRIVSDLLILSELEEKKRRDFEFKPLDFAAIVESIIKIYREKIAARELDLEVNIDPGLPVFKGEKFKIEQMFINLIDNAVKYTDKGKIEIAISKRQERKDIAIRVKNTGLVIPRESLPRIFERFYVVDKSRSRRLGGTGLGLSIVKHVVLLHNGEISADSSKKGGTVFTIHLPVDNGH
ncbi:MAG: HAMP domain-containing protein [Candidatus Aminicenantes bacterium]|nr:HAMP domain-containing protein [Candidatus Aminicenantes bacterium]